MYVVLHLALVIKTEIYLVPWVLLSTKGNYKTKQKTKIKISVFKTETIWPEVLYSWLPELKRDLDWRPKVFHINLWIQNESPSQEVTVVCVYLSFDTEKKLHNSRISAMIFVCPSTLATNPISVQLEKNEQVLVYGACCLRPGWSKFTVLVVLIQPKCRWWSFQAAERML